MMMPRHPYLDHDGPIAFAHRGGMSVAPENTMPAFEHAVSLGFRYLETDVHRTVDGDLVAFHDTDLKRTCGLDQRIADMTAAEIAGVRVGGTAPIPTMRALLERWPDHRFNIDCKADDALEPLGALIDDLDALDRVCIGSFSDDRLDRLRRRFGGRLLTAMGPREIAILRLFRRRRGSGPRVAQVPVRASSAGLLRHVTVTTPRFVADAHRKSVPIHVWTINDAAEMHRLLDLGVDGLMTDRPEMLRTVLDDRGEWAA